MRKVYKVEKASVVSYLNTIWENFGKKLSEKTKQGSVTI